MLLKSKDNKTEDGGAIVALSQVFEIGYLVAIPAVIFSLTGRYFDRIFGTSPLFLLLGIFAFILLSSYLIYKRVQRFL
jgi:hypothetical protein